jgi:hypothetical protein
LAAEALGPEPCGRARFSAAAGKGPSAAGSTVRKSPMGATGPLTGALTGTSTGTLTGTSTGALTGTSTGALAGTMAGAPGALWVAAPFNRVAPPPELPAAGEAAGKGSRGAVGDARPGFRAASSCSGGLVKSSPGGCCGRGNAPLPSALSCTAHVGTSCRAWTPGGSCHRISLHHLREQRQLQILLS